jgi:uncharacterized protein (TIRG00374 family)
MYLAARRLDLASLGAVLASAKLFPWLPLAIAAYLTGHLVRGLRCRLLLSKEANLGRLTAANVVVVGYAANNVFPARLGELVRAGMLTERTGVPLAQSLAVTFIERALDGLAILLLLVAGVMSGHAPAWAHELVHVAAVVFCGALLAILCAANAPGAVLSLSSRVGSRLPGRWHDRLVSLATSVTRAAACLHGFRQITLLSAYSLLVWVLETGLFLALLPAFGIAPSLSLSATAMSVTNLGLLIPSSPGFIGPFHYFCSRTLMAQGISEATGVAYTSVVHLAFFIPVTLWGAGVMLWYGVEVGATAALTRAARASGRASVRDGLVLHEIGPIAPPALDLGPSRFEQALVEALIVDDPSQADPKILRNVAEFVHGQLQALAPELRLMLDVGLSGFRFATRVRFLRGYCELSPETRRRWTRQWADGRLVLARRLMKPVRATALLGYYDHPALREAADVVPLRTSALREAPAAQGQVP